MNGGTVKCPKCGYEQITYAEAKVQCSSPTGCRHNYRRHGHEIPGRTPQNGPPGDGAFHNGKELITGWKPGAYLHPEMLEK